MNKLRLCALLFAISVLFFAQAPTIAQASTLSYDVTLTTFGGSQVGAGSFSISEPSGGHGLLGAGNGLLSMNLDVGGVTFGTNDSAVQYAHSGSTFLLTGIFGLSGVDAFLSLAYGNNGLFSLLDIANGNVISSGFMSVSQTPLPASLPLLAAGLGILAMLGWYRKRRVASYLVA